MTVSTVWASGEAELPSQSSLFAWWGWPSQAVVLNSACNQNDPRSFRTVTPRQYHPSTRFLFNGSGVQPGHQDFCRDPPMFVQPRLKATTEQFRIPPNTYLVLEIIAVAFWSSIMLFYTVVCNNKRITLMRESQLLWNAGSWKIFMWSLPLSYTGRGSLRRSTHYFTISSFHFLERVVSFLTTCHPIIQHTLFPLFHYIQNLECSSDVISLFRMTRDSPPQFSRHHRFCWPEQTRVSKWIDSP